MDNFLIWWSDLSTHPALIWKPRLFESFTPIAGTSHPTLHKGASTSFSSAHQLPSARVAYTKVEAQFKLRAIPYTHVNPTSALSQSSALSHIQSSLARSIPALCVQSSDILSGAPAAEAAMPNIRVIPLNWWSDKKAQVVTCVKLKYVQQPVGKRAAAGVGANGSDIIRPSKRIIYDATEAVVSFLSEQVDTCVDEFLEEWARVSKMVVIAREGEFLDVLLFAVFVLTVFWCSRSNGERKEMARRPTPFLRPTNRRVCLCLSKHT